MSCKIILILMCFTILVSGCKNNTSNDVYTNSEQNGTVKSNNLTFEKPDEVFLVAVFEDGVASINETVFIKEGENFTIYPVLKYKGEYYSEAKFIDINGVSYETKPLNDNMSFKLFKVCPVMKGYDNFSGVSREDMSDYIVPIEYQLETIDVNAITNEVLESGYGTYYFGINLDDLLELNNDRFSTEAFLHKAYKGKIVQVAYRENDTYIGYLKELLHTPFVFVPKYHMGAHQTDERVGSDCAELAIYGIRRMGYDVPYCGPANIHKYATKVVNGTIYLDKSDDSGVYKDEESNFVEIGNNGVQPGDIIHFREQVSVFYEDQGIFGVLDAEDLLIQSYYNEPEIVSIKESGFYGYSIEIYRFNY